MNEHDMDQSQSSVSPEINIESPASKPGNRFRFLKTASKVVVLSIALLSVALLTAAVFELPIPLGFLKKPIEDAVLSATGRRISLDGPVSIIPGLSPKVEVSRVHIQNPENWPSDIFASIAHFSGKVDVVALIQRRIHIKQLVSEGIDLNLAVRPNGDNNWTFTTTAPQNSSEDRPPGEPFEFAGIDLVSVTDAKAVYANTALKSHIRIELSHLKGTAGAHEPLKFELGGSFQGEAFTAALSGDPAVRLLNGNSRWPFDLRASGPGAVLTVDGAVRGAEGLEFNASLNAENGDIGEFSRLLTGTNGVRGKLGSLRLDASSRGQDAAALIKGMAMSLVVNQADLSYGNAPGMAPVSFAVDTLELLLPAGGALQLNASGSLLEQEFKLKFRGGNIDELFQMASWPVDLQLNGAGTELHIAGALAPPAGETGSELNFKLSGKRIGDSARWTGASPESALPYSASGRITHISGGWKLHSFKANLGRTDISAEIEKKRLMPRPLLIAALRFGRVDLEELSRAFSASDLPRTDEKPPQSAAKITLDMPILPMDLELGDADITISVNHFETGGVDLRKIYLTGNLRDGRINKSPFKATIGETAFQGHFKFDPLGNMPRAGFKLFSRDMDVGRLLADFGVAEGLMASAERIEFDVMLKGQSLGAMAKHSEFTATIKEGLWVLRDANTGGKLPITISDAHLQILPDQPVKLTQNVIIREVPAKIEFSTDHPSRVKNLSRPEVQLRLETSGAELELISNLSFPLRQGDLNFAMRMQGGQLADLTPLLGIQLPPFGPYELHGKFGILPEGYALDDLSVKVGESRLSGGIGLRTTGQRPDIGIDLAAQMIQLDDFRKVHEETERGEAEPEADEEIEEDAEQSEGRPFFTPASLRRFNGHFNLNVEDVYSGGDRLGDGHVKISLAEGRFLMDPLVLNIPAGSFNAAFQTEPEGDALKSSLKVKIDAFDVGVLARRNNPDTDMGGWLSLDLELAANKGYVSDMLSNADGYLNFAVIPENFKSGIIDLWAVNILVAILPKADSSADSVVNCVIARFDINDGLMKHKTILLDTSKIRVQGKGTIDFKAEEMELTLVPRAKKPQFFSLETPVKINGTIQDINARIASGAVVGTTFRFFTSPFTTPFRKLFGKKLPADGHDVCEDPMAP